MNTIPLPGCAPVPLAHYLKALGILRLLSQNSDFGDAEVQGFWKDRVFHLSTKLDEKHLVEFFLYHYQPTPVIVPWSGSDFFDVDWTTNPKKLPAKFKDRPTSSTVIEAFIATTSPRLSGYRDVLSQVPRAFAASKVKAKKDIEGAAKSDNKARFLQVLRNLLPDDTVAWLDCATAIEADQLAFNTILGSGGGSDGNSHFSDNFMQALWMVLPEFDEQQLKPIKAASSEPFDSKLALQSSLMGTSESAVTISKFSPVLFDSSRVGGPNSTSGFDAVSASNPWDFVLMIEGAFLFAGAVSKKLRSPRTGVARFPFLLEATSVGLASVGSRDEGREIWLPLWQTPASFGEVAQVFSEARIERFGQIATTGFDAFIALAQHGVDRGIQKFQRIGLVRGRVGGDNYYTSIDQGIFEVKDVKAIDILRPLDKWYSELRRFAANEIECPASILRALRQYEASVETLSQKGEEAVLKVLIALGQIEKAMAKSLRQVKKAGISPVPLLGTDWLKYITPDTLDQPVFRLARTLAATRGEYDDHEVIFIRQHLEPVVLRYKTVSWEENPSNDVVWHEGNFLRVLNNIFSRRLLKASQSGIKGFPDWSPYPARLEDIALFIDGDIKLDHLFDLIWALGLIAWPPEPEFSDEVAFRTDQPSPSSLYAKMRLCFRPKLGEEKYVPAVPTIHHLAEVGEGKRASIMAARRLFASGYEPVLREIPDIEKKVSIQTAAALLFPIAPRLYSATEPKRFSDLQKSVLRTKENT